MCISILYFFIYIIEIFVKIINAAFSMIESFLFLFQCSSALMFIEDLKDLKTTPSVSRINRELYIIYHQLFWTNVYLSFNTISILMSY